MRQGNFVLAVAIASFLGFHVVVADFQQGAHDWRPFEHWTHAHGVPFRTLVIIHIQVLIHTDVHQIPTVSQSNGTVIDNTDHVAIVVHAAALRLTFTLRGHGVGGVLNNKLVVAFQHALGMFNSTHPAVFRRARLQVIVVRNVGVAVVNAQFQRAARVNFQAGPAHVKDVIRYVVVVGAFAGNRIAIAKGRGTAGLRRTRCGKSKFTRANVDVFQTRART